MRTIRIMLVDDHDVVRTGLRTYLNTQEGLEVVGEAQDGTSAIELVRQVQPDVVVMDITMAEMDGLEATRRIKLTNPNCKVLALTVHSDKQYFFEMLKAGAVGYVTKQAAAEELVASIRAVAEGNVYLQPALAMWLLEDYRRLLKKAPWEHSNTGDGNELEILSDRERQVIECVAQGMTNIQAGETLGISPKTIARHRERIMTKLDIHSCAELVHFAIRTGIIDL